MPRRSPLLLCLLTVPFSMPAQAQMARIDSAASDDPVGVLVMAHGGSAEWNEAVAEAVGPLSHSLPTAVALGMADPVTIGSALDSLRSLGVRRVAVVRMFLSGASFRDQTRFLLGLSDVPPETFMQMDSPDDTPPAPLAHGLQVATHEGGLVDSEQARRILAERVSALSLAPETESVLLLAHGMGRDSDNTDLLGAIAQIGTAVQARPFHTVRSEALREDWASPREVAEQDIRSFVAQETEAGRRVLVIPVRLSGFGPYAAVLDGLTYTPGEGLLPHAGIGAWIAETAGDIFCTRGWQNPLVTCVGRADPSERSARLTRAR